MRLEGMILIRAALPRVGVFFSPSLNVHLIKFLQPGVLQAIKAVNGVDYSYTPAAVIERTGSFRDISFYSVASRDTGYGYLIPASEIVPTGEEIFAAVRVLAKHIISQV